MSVSIIKCEEWQCYGRNEPITVWGTPMPFALDSTGNFFPGKDCDAPFIFLMPGDNNKNGIDEIRRDACGHALPTLQGELFWQRRDGTANVSTATDATMTSTGTGAFQIAFTFPYPTNVSVNFSGLNNTGADTTNDSWLEVITPMTRWNAGTGSSIATTDDVQEGTIIHQAGNTATSEGVWEDVTEIKIRFQNGAGNPWTAVPTITASHDGYQKEQCQVECKECGPLTGPEVRDVVGIPFVGPNGIPGGTLTSATGVNNPFTFTLPHTKNPIADCPDGDCPTPQGQMYNIGGTLNLSVSSGGGMSASSGGTQCRSYRLVFPYPVDVQMTAGSFNGPAGETLRIRTPAELIAGPGSSHPSGTIASGAVWSNGNQSGSNGSTFIWRNVTLVEITHCSDGSFTSETGWSFIRYPDGFWDDCDATQHLLTESGKPCQEPSNYLQPTEIAGGVGDDGVTTSVIDPNGDVRTFFYDLQEGWFHTVTISNIDTNGGNYENPCSIKIIRTDNFTNSTLRISAPQGLAGAPGNIITLTSSNSYGAQQGEAIQLSYCKDCRNGAGSWYIG